MIVSKTSYQDLSETILISLDSFQGIVKVCLALIVIFHRIFPLQQRHRSDNQVNHRKSQVLRNNQLKNEIWSKVSNA